MPSATTASQLCHIIDAHKLYPVFQPIVDLRFNRLHGYESLIRGPVDSPLHSPDQLFKTAMAHKMMGQLEYACREISCTQFSALNAEGKLFLNVSPMSLLESGYEYGMTHKILEQFDIPANKVVIEISEQYPVDDYSLIREATEHYKAMGFEIAIDDLGAGYAGLRSWQEIRPNYVKIDRHFIDGIDKDPVKREFVRSIQEIAKQLDCQVVAECIETVEELNTILSLGIRFGQGYYLGRPQQQPETSQQVLKKLHLSTGTARHVLRKSMPVGDLAIKSAVIHPDLPISEVMKMIFKNPAISCLPIIKNNKPMGLIERQDLFETFSVPYARELHERKPAHYFMNSDIVIVDCNDAIEEASRRLTMNQNETLAPYFIITDNGNFHGLGLTSALLRKITEQQMRNARYANPLTMVPGNVPIYEHIEEKLQRNADFHVAYFDLNHFKPFNDYYGYSLGDNVIVTLAEILQATVTNLDDFIGHIGGDDFVVIFDSPDCVEICQRVVSEFSRQVKKFYKEADIRAGGIWGTNRTGEQQFFELLTLAVGIVHPDPIFCRHYHDIASLAMDAKMQAKRIDSNHVFYSRRRRPEQSSQSLQGSEWNSPNDPHRLRAV